MEGEREREWMECLDAAWTSPLWPVTCIRNGGGDVMLRQ